MNRQKKPSSTKTIIHEKDLVEPVEYRSSISLGIYGFPSQMVFMEDLQMLNTSDFINDSIIRFYATYFIQCSDTPESFLLLDYQTTTLFEANSNREIRHNRENMIFIPINVNMAHWQLLVIINVFHDTKETAVFLLDSL